MNREEKLQEKLLRETQLKNRVKCYLSDTGVSQTAFCHKCNFTYNFFWSWSHGARGMKKETYDRVDDYLKKWGY